MMSTSGPGAAARGQCRSASRHVEQRDIHSAGLQMNSHRIIQTNYKLIRVGRAVAVAAAVRGPCS